MKLFATIPAFIFVLIFTGGTLLNATVQTSVIPGLKIYTEDAPPLNFIKNKKLVGVAVAVVHEIQKRIGDKTPIEVVPWARGYKAALEEPNTVLFSTTRTDERENLFKWVGPLASKKWVIVVRKDSKIDIKSLEDAKKISSIGTADQDAKEQYLKTEGFTNLNSVQYDALNFKKLLSERIEALITNEEDIEPYAMTAGANVTDFKIAYTVQKRDLFIAFSSKTNDDIVKKWQTAFSEMNKDGTYKSILKQY